MNCSPFDLRDYWLEELGAAERREVETHLSGCGNCREELARLRATQAALLRLPEEEIPRRIAFVSDKVFEPSRAARWWAAFSLHVPKLAFSMALLLAVFFGGAWISKPTVTVEGGRWQIAFGGNAAAEARHTADMKAVEQSFELLDKQMQLLYRQSAEIRPAAYRQ